MFRRLAKPLDRLGVILREALARPIRQAKAIATTDDLIFCYGCITHIASFRSFAPPFYGLRVVLRDTMSLLVTQTKVDLSARVTLLRRLAIPLDRFRIVLRGAFSILVAHAKVDLRASITLLRRLSVPPDRLRIILRETKPSRVAPTESALPTSIPLFPPPCGAT